MDNKEFKIKYLCDTPKLREEGLMFKSPLAPDECAYFIFKHSNSLSFWNKNVSFDIDVIFCDETKKIQKIGHLKAGQEYPPTSVMTPCMYVIEVISQNFGKNNNFTHFIKKEDNIVFYNEKEESFFGNDIFQKFSSTIRSVRS